ncbi:hypothetical protein B0J18DRAFT_205800 [Chaetomium sp. MPI-SDFR-AT-0129]|nr:hypothetical protein B0J18DRAFT_205800 [Chaetomium sp. MPI-SDFR-AT-0129]
MGRFSLLAGRDFTRLSLFHPCFNVSGICSGHGKELGGQKRSDFCFWHIDSCFVFCSFQLLTPLLFLRRLRLLTRAGHQHPGNDTFIPPHISITVHKTDGADEFLLAHCGRKGCWAGSRNNEDTPWCFRQRCTLVIIYVVTIAQCLVCENLTDIFWPSLSFARLLFVMREFG